jgi:cysteine-rich repeat protein
LFQCVLKLACIQSAFLISVGCSGNRISTPAASDGPIESVIGPAQDGGGNDGWIGDAVLETTSEDILDTNVPDISADQRAVQLQEVSLPDSISSVGFVDADVTLDLDVDANSLGIIGLSCDTRGALACSSTDPKQSMICRSNGWQVLSTCGDQQRCDRTSGTCADISPACLAHDSGYSFCNPNGTLSTCGPDLVTLVTIPCSGICQAGICQADRCGDGKIQGIEACDDGNTIVADGCEPDCTRTEVIQLAAGLTQSCVLFKSGYVRCWGGNDHGQLGLATKQDLSSSQPYQLGPINLGLPAVFLAAGYRHVCALMADESVQCWGRNDFGQLGLGHANDIGDDEVPTIAISKVLLGKSVKQIAAGGDTTCALLEDASVRCWGHNDFGQLGLGHTNNIGDDEPPTADNAQVTLGGTPTAIATSGDHTCALLTTNQIRCWGLNQQGELGIGSTDNVGDNELPTAVAPIVYRDPAPILGLSAGGAHTCINMVSLVFGPDYKCWGYDGDGSLGLGWIEDDPLKLADDWATSSWQFSVMQLVCGVQHTCVLLGSHELRCIGLNDYAQLGLPSMATVGVTAPPNFGVPVDFGKAANGTDIYATQFATGSYHNCALLNTGQIRCWGMNKDGQLGLGYKSPEPSGFVGGTPDTTPGKLPSVQILPP